MRRIFIGGNWKMNKNLADTREFFQALKPLVRDVSDLEIFIYPPFTLIPTSTDLCQDTNIKIGGQNLYFKDSGAFTGDISASMLKDVGCSSVIVGHSERRHVFGEPDEIMAPKVKAALESGLTTVYCVGEKLDQREANKTEEVLERQLSTGMEGFSSEQLGKLVIAYEPVWAIGTGKSATQKDAQDACAYIRGFMEKRFDRDSAQQLPIAYGGSVAPKNFHDYITCPDIDGALIGGASLKPNSFADIINFDRKILSV
ncbi:triose-phosphate isomerase [Candidatus Riflebacteria bacterium]